MKKLFIYFAEIYYSWKDKRDYRKLVQTTDSHSRQLNERCFAITDGKTIVICTRHQWRTMKHFGIANPNATVLWLKKESFYYSAIPNEPQCENRNKRYHQWKNEQRGIKL